MSLPTIESSYVTHTTKGIQGFDHLDYPVIRVALEVLNATESYLWVNFSHGHPFSKLIDLLALHPWIGAGLWCIRVFGC
jgi:hypothetical protein